MTGYDWFPENLLVILEHEPFFRYHFALARGTVRVQRVRETSNALRHDFECVRGLSSSTCNRSRADGHSPNGLALVETQRLGMHSVSELMRLPLPAESITTFICQT